MRNSSLTINTVLFLALTACSAVDDELQDSSQHSESGEPDESGQEEEFKVFPLPDDPNPYWCDDTCSLYSDCGQTCDEYPIGLSTCGNFGICNDSDDDGYLYPADNCPLTSNDQSDCDYDEIGDACDPLSGTVDTEIITQYDGTAWGPSQTILCTCNGVKYRSVYDIYGEYLQTETTYCAGPMSGQTDTDLEYQGSEPVFSCYGVYGGCALNQNGCWDTPFPTC